MGARGESAHSPFSILYLRKRISQSSSLGLADMRLVWNFNQFNMTRTCWQRERASSRICWSFIFLDFEPGCRMDQSDLSLQHFYFFQINFDFRYHLMFSISLIKIKMCAFHSWSELPSIRIRLALHKINFDWIKFWFILVFSFLLNFRFNW